MRTTIRLDDELLARLKVEAARSGRTLNSVIEDAVRESLARRERLPRQRAVRHPVFAGSKLRPGVDLDDSAALLDLMEGTDR
ncbi:MAG: ribbon-helix-helix protein, CopG family [Chloroflexi bacterium]|nr:ribbon-helix-helix protein, CopG family [Chloroflexota bacterium]